MFNFMKKNRKDFASVPESNKVADIVIPVIPVKKGPMIVKRGIIIIQKLVETRDNPEKFLEKLTVSSLLKHVPALIDIAAEEFFALLAYVLDVDVSQVEKLSVANLMRVLIKLTEVNEMAEIVGPLFHCLREVFQQTRRQ